MWAFPGGKLDEEDYDQFIKESKKYKRAADRWAFSGGEPDEED